MIIKEGGKIDVLTDGYSERPCSMKSGILKEIKEIKEIKNFKEISLRFAKLIGKEGIIIDYDVQDNKIVMFPSMPLDGGLGSYLFLKKRDSFVEINKSGSVVVFISRSDYLQIMLPVSHQVPGASLSFSLWLYRQPLFLVSSSLPENNLGSDIQGVS